MLHIFPIANRCSAEHALGGDHQIETTCSTEDGVEQFKEKKIAEVMSVNPIKGNMPGWSACTTSSTLMIGPIIHFGLATLGW